MYGSLQNNFSHPVHYHARFITFFEGLINSEFYQDCIVTVSNGHSDVINLWRRSDPLIPLRLWMFFWIFQSRTNFGHFWVISRKNSFFALKIAKKYVFHYGITLKLFQNALKLHAKINFWNTIELEWLQSKFFAWDFSLEKEVIKIAIWTCINM